MVGAGQVALGPAGRAAGQVDQCPGGARPGLEEAVAGRPQHPDRPPQVIERLGVPA